MKKFCLFLFWTAIAAGLIIRFMALSYDGIFDMAVYHEWGLNTLNNGLSASYQRIYLPFQFQIFELGAWLTIKLNTEYFVGLKLVNLLFDCGNLIILYLIFKKINVSKYYLILYWLHPWFLIMFTQGYCDFQFTFFILFSILYALKATSRSYLIAGIFLGFAFLMKPQVQVIMLSLIIYSLYIYYKERDVKLFNLFIFPVILFLDYSLYFLVESGNPFRLLRAYVNIGHAIPLNANFLNGWFPVAYYLKNPGDPIYSVTDDLSILNFTFRTAAILSLLLLIGFFISKIYKNSFNLDFKYNYLLIALFSTFIFPFIMTSAHENHLFLATVLLIPVLGKIKNLPAILSIHILLLLQFFNLHGLYGYASGKYIGIININYTYEIAFVLSLIALFAFIILVVYFISPKSGFLTQMKLSGSH